MNPLEVVDCGILTTVIVEGYWLPPYDVVLSGESH